MDEVERQRLVELLHGLGATDAEIATAEADGSVGGLALDLALRDGPVASFRDSARREGLDVAEAARYWRALGFPEPDPDTTLVSSDLCEALALVGNVGNQLLGEDGTLALARVLGSATSRVAQAMVDTFRARFEAPRLATGTAYPDVVSVYISVARDILPPFLDAMGAILRRHLVATAAGTWSIDAERTATSRQVAVGFIDLVGYTALARTLAPGELGSLIGEFEQLTTDAAARHAGRVVKLIGDAAMFAADDAGRACRIALEIVEAAARSSRLPSLRGGLAAGEAVALQGDLFGDVVNLAARLVAVAPEGVVLADERVRATAGAGLAFEPLAPQQLKGFGTPAVAYVVGSGAP